MTKRTIALVTVVSVIVLGSVAVAAARGWGPMGVWPGKSLTEKAQELGLSDAQVTQITQIQTKYQQELDTLRTSLGAKMKEARDAASQTPPNQTARGAAKAAAADIQKQIADLTQKMHDEINAVLTKEQLAKIGSSIGLGMPGLGMPRGFGPMGGMFRKRGPDGTGTTQPGGTGTTQDIKSYGARLAEQLNLTDQQLATLQKLQSDYFAQVAPLNTQLMQKSNELRLMQWQKSPDTAAMTAKREEIKSIQQQIQDLSAKLKEQMNAVLTQDQLAALGQKAGMRCPGFGFHMGFGPKRGIR